MKHFIALVPMAGQHEGKIGQHSTDQQNEAAAIKWATNRFSRPAVIVDMTKHNNANSLASEVAERLYNEGVKVNSSNDPGKAP